VIAVQLSWLLTV